MYIVGKTCIDLFAYCHTWYIASYIDTKTGPLRTAFGCQNLDLDHFWQPKLVHPQDHFWLPKFASGPVLAAKSGPGGAGFGQDHFSHDRSPRTLIGRYRWWHCLLYRTVTWYILSTIHMTQGIYWLPLRDQKWVQRMPSLTIMSMGVSFQVESGRPSWRVDLAPLKQRTAESMSEKASLHRIIFIVSQYSDEYFWLTMQVNLL